MLVINRTVIYCFHSLIFLIPHSVRHIDGRPTTRNLLDKVVWDVAKDWYDLGLHLVDEESVCRLRNIQANNRDVEVCCIEMLQFWLQVDPQASWRQLVDVLGTINYNYLAVKIEDWLKEFPPLAACMC